MVVRAYLLATCAVLPLLAPELWTGFRLAQADPVLSAISVMEQPLSVRSPAGMWAMGLTLAWFALAYTHRDFALWEAALVLIGGGAALARAGNLWVEAAAVLLPLARQAALNDARMAEASSRGGKKLRLAMFSGVVAATLLVAALTLIQTRPPQLPAAAFDTVRQSTTSGNVLANWRWAGELQRGLGGQRQVFGSAGLASESSDFWRDYLRIAQGHEHWAGLLREMHVDTLVLDSSDQQRPAADLIRGSSDWQVTYDLGNTLVAERASP